MVADVADSVAVAAGGLSFSLSSSVAVVADLAVADAAVVDAAALVADAN